MVEEENDFQDIFSPNFGLVGKSVADEETNNNGDPTTPKIQEEETPKTDIQYNSRKPKWWKQVAGRTTKAQKQAIANMEAHHLPNNIKWGEFYDWSTVFPHLQKDDDSHEIWFEIGFGNGENLLALAHKYPQRYIVGAEIHEPGLGKVYQRLQQALRENRYWTGYDEYQNKNESTPSSTDVITAEGDADDDEPTSTQQDLDDAAIYSNLRIYGGDGLKVLSRIPSDSLAAVLITFPDPFFKKGHEQWRVIQQHSLRDIHRILKSSGRLFLATDHEGFHQWSHSMVDLVNQQAVFFEQVVDTPDRNEWLPAISKYEQKGWDEGRKTWLSCWEVQK
jgi:tRNA G46 methylase TrmB